MTMQNQTLRAVADASDPLPGIGTELNQTKNSLVCVFDFATLGGAISTIQLKDSQGNAAVLPAGSVITSVFIDSVVAVTSAGSATIALTTGVNAGDLLAATAKASFSANALVAGVPVGTAATSVKVPNTVAQGGTPISAVIAVAALTAGRFYVIINFDRSGF